MAGRCRQFIVAAVGGTALMMGIKRAEVIRDHLQVARWFRGWIGLALAMTAMLCFHPAVHRVFHIEHRPSVRATTYSAKRNPQRISHGVSQAAIGAGRDIQKMDAAIEQKLFKFLCSRAPLSALQRVVLEKAITKQAVAFKHTPGKQAAHVEGTHPSPFQDVAQADQNPVQSDSSAVLGPGSRAHAGGQRPAAAGEQCDQNDLSHPAHNPEDVRSQPDWSGGVDGELRGREERLRLNGTERDGPAL